mgnify:FL=1
MIYNQEGEEIGTWSEDFGPQLNTKGNIQAAVIKQDVSREKTRKQSIVALAEGGNSPIFNHKVKRGRGLSNPPLPPPPTKESAKKERDSDFDSDDSFGSDSDEDKVISPPVLKSGPPPLPSLAKKNKPPLATIPSQGANEDFDSDPDVKFTDGIAVGRDKASSIFESTNPLSSRGNKKEKKKGKRSSKGKPVTDHIKPSGFVIRYATFLTKKPIFCYCLSTFMMMFFGLIGFVARWEDLPDFEKAAEGFEPRGTVISGQMKAYGRHLQDAQCRGIVSATPGGNRSYYQWESIADDDEINHKDYDRDGYIDEAYCNKYAPGRLQVKTQTRKLLDMNFGVDSVDGDGVDIFNAEFSFEKFYDHSHDSYKSNFDSSDDFTRRVLQGNIKITDPVPSEDCSHDDAVVSRGGAVNVVFTAFTDSDVLHPEVLHRVCAIDKMIRDHGSFNPDFCPLQPRRVYNSSRGLEFICCKSRHIANSVALYNGKDDCADINATDVANFKDFIGGCAKYYHKTGELRACPTHASAEEIAVCRSDNNVPEKCWFDNIAYDTFNALADWKYSDPHNQTMTSTKIVIPVQSYTTDWLKGVHNLLLPYQNEVTAGAKLVAWDTKVKFLLFTDQLQIDGILAVAAFVCVFVLMWMQTSSFFISILAFIEIFTALAVAYFMYMVMFWLPFFPFLNLVGIFIVIGIGADDVFVFMDAWKQADAMMVLGEKSKKWSKNKRRARKMAWVLQRAGSAMFVTSLTTSCALFASAVSNITSLKCFGIYTGLVVLCDFFLMVTYLPAVVLIHDMYIKKKVSRKQELPCCRVCIQPKDKNELRIAEKWFQDVVFPFVYKFRWPIVAVVGGVSCAMTIKAQGLQRPTTGDFQLFQVGHPMEDYALFWKRDFFQDGLSKEGARAFFPVRFVWGLEPVDNGNKMDPASHGEAQWYNLDIKSPDTQQWLVDLCADVRSQDWYKFIDKDTESTEMCALESFKEWVEMPCGNTTNYADRREPGWEKYFPARCDESEERCGPKCCSLEFPMASASQYNGCMYQWGRTFGRDYNTGLFFDRDGGAAVRAIVFQFLTNHEFTSSFNDAQEFYETIRDYTEKKMKTAPDGTGLQNGFATSELDFYDLQKSIGEGAYSSAAVSTAIAFLVLVTTTKNVILTLYSVITIVFICGFSTGILVFDGWELNILESIIFSVAVGVSVDFVAHYSHAYAQAPMDERGGKVKSSLTVMGVSISSASATTFMAGLVMCFSKTLFFYKFGFFLVLIMGLSWFLSTFFLNSLLAVMGPVGKWGYIFWWYKGINRRELVDEDGLLKDTGLQTTSDRQFEMIKKQNSSYVLKSER